MFCPSHPIFLPQTENCLYRARVQVRMYNKEVVSCVFTAEARATRAHKTRYYYYYYNSWWMSGVSGLVGIPRASEAALYSLSPSLSLPHLCFPYSHVLTHWARRNPTHTKPPSSLHWMKPPLFPPQRKLNAGRLTFRP